VRCTTISLLFPLALLMGVACRAVPPAEPASRAAVRQPPRLAAPSTPADVEVASCRAEPGTVYGDEVVLFRIDAPRAGRARVVLLDEKGQKLRQERLEVPGELSLQGLESGDFRLEVSGGSATCAVTVNRELSRASQTAR
jgi:hypothetical protein